jgi:hypothetical protein
MTLTEEQFDKIKWCLPVQRGNVKTENLAFVRALLYVVENGCKGKRGACRFAHTNC